MTFQQRFRGDRGASLVEFAFAMPLLILLIFGMIEFGWLFSQHLDVRHGAREGARLAAVNYPDGPPPGSFAGTDADRRDALVDEICSRMQTASGVKITLETTGGVGDPATATVTAPGETLSGLLDFAIPSDLELSSSVEIRLEQAATWANTAATGQACL